jgi:hypothetical protein
LTDKTIFSKNALHVEKRVVGNNQFVHASYTCKVIRIDGLDTPSFPKRFQCAVRIKGLAGDDT